MHHQFLLLKVADEGGSVPFRVGFLELCWVGNPVLPLSNLMSFLCLSFLRLEAGNNDTAPCNNRVVTWISQVYQAELLSGNKNHSEYLNQKGNLMHEIRNIEINERLEQQAPGWRNGLGKTVPNRPCVPPSGRWPLDRDRNAWLQEHSATAVT